ncbi:MAG: hypothetical protein ACYC1C_01900 [Chloroflexota bacterium]
MAVTDATHDDREPGSADVIPSVPTDPPEVATHSPGPLATPSDRDMVANQAEGSPARPGSSVTLRPGLKLVVSLRPNGEGRYRAFVGLGAEGCDPVLRSVEVAELAGLLGMLPCLVEDAESRWQTSPRNPRQAGPARGPGEAPARVAAVPNAEPDRGHEAETTPRSPEVEPTRKPGQGQLTLFG